MWMLMGVSAMAEEPVALWDQVAMASGQAAWDDVDHLRFTWTHVPSDATRSYDWDVPAGTVEVTLGTESLTVPVSGADLEGAQLEAHKTFINDSYWLLFEHKAATDSVARAEVPTSEVFPTAVSAYEVRYAADGGYTPADRYVVYVQADGHPAGWSYFPGGSEEPRLSTTRADWTASGGLTVPTTFDTPDGTPLIRISGVEVTSR